MAYKHNDYFVVFSISNISMPPKKSTTKVVFKKTNTMKEGCQKTDTVLSITYSTFQELPAEENFTEVSAVTGSQSLVEVISDISDVYHSFVN